MEYWDVIEQNIKQIWAATGSLLLIKFLERGSAKF